MGPDGEAAPVQCPNIARVSRGMAPSVRLEFNVHPWMNRQTRGGVRSRIRQPPTNAGAPPARRRPHSDEDLGIPISKGHGRPSVPPCDVARRCAFVPPGLSPPKTPARTLWTSDVQHRRHSSAVAPSGTGPAPHQAPRPSLFHARPLNPMAHAPFWCPRSVGPRRLNRLNHRQPVRPPSHSQHGAVVVRMVRFWMGSAADPQATRYGPIPLDSCLPSAPRLAVWAPRGGPLLS